MNIYVLISGRDRSVIAVFATRFLASTFAELHNVDSWEILERKYFDC